MDHVFNVLRHHHTVLGFAAGRLFYGTIFRLRSRFQGGTLWAIARSSTHDNGGIGWVCCQGVRGVIVKLAFQRGSVEPTHNFKLDRIFQVLIDAPGRLWSQFCHGGWSRQEDSR